MTFSQVLSPGASAGAALENSKYDKLKSLPYTLATIKYFRGYAPSMMEGVKKNNCLETGSGFNPKELDLEQIPMREFSVDMPVAQLLGRDLRAMFSDVLDEPVPQRFIDLLEKLETEDQP